MPLIFQIRALHHVTHLQLIRRFSIFDPDFPLSLRIYEQRVAGSLADYDAVLDAQFIVREAL